MALATEHSPGDFPFKDRETFFISRQRYLCNWVDILQLWILHVPDD